MFCSKCGTQMPDAANYCWNCGTRLKEGDTEQGADAQSEAAAQQPVWQHIGIELITIPAGEFFYGDDKKTIALPEYRIAKTPVTNAQYMAFLDATDYQPPYTWVGGQIPQGRENHPVDHAYFHDAQAFCRWADLRLPTEQEWEKAARGTDGREYPWGDWQLGRCNSRAENILGTTPVDCYPNGASPYGVLDMAGNVSEWCANWYESDKRAVRGGSRYGVKVAYRSGLLIDRNWIGFRCACSP